MRTPWGARRERWEQDLAAAGELRAARRLAREDVTVLGEQVAGLDVDVEGSRGHEVRDFHQEALDAYAAAAGGSTSRCRSAAAPASSTPSTARR